MLLGIWRNIEHLEASLNLSELELVVSAARAREERNNRWLAMVNGIDLNKFEERDAQEYVEERKRWLEAQSHGMSKEEFELDEFGIDIEIE